MYPQQFITDILNYSFIRMIVEVPTQLMDIWNNPI